LVLIFAFNNAKSQDYYSGDTVYIVISDTSQILSEDTIQTVDLKSGKAWPEYFKVGKRQYKNPLYTLAEDVVGKSKATTIVLILLTGPLGGHRLYLGTKPIVPIVYTLTLGGGVGILPFIDLVVVCFSKDMTRFENNDKIFMWAKE
jgi:TM2 domain-containing membrane protein YozV